MQTFLAPLEYRVTHAYAVVRAQPTRASAELGRSECGTVVSIAGQWRGWLRLALADGWMLLDATALDLGALLVRHEHSVTDTAVRRRRVSRAAGAYTWGDPTCARNADDSVHHFEHGHGVAIAATSGGWGKCWIDLPAAECTARVRAGWVLLDDFVHAADEPAPALATLASASASFPPLPRHGATAADAQSLLARIWCHVLALHDELFSSSFCSVGSASFGSVAELTAAAAAAASLAAAHGMELPEGWEELSLESCVAASKGPRGCRWTRPERQERRRRSAMQTRQADDVETAQLLTTSDGDHGPHTQGAKRALQQVILERDGRDRLTPLRPIGGLSACATGDANAARALRALGWDPSHAADKHGSTALMWAAGGGHLPLVRWLVEECAVGVDAANKEQRTALQWACKTGCARVASYLLTAGADPMHRMKDGSTAFDWAVASADVPTMELLAADERVDIHALNKFGCAAVSWAAASGDVATLRWLQARGFALDHINPAGHGAVAKAAWRGHDAALEWLLHADDGPQLVAQLRLADGGGRLPVELARLNGKLRTAGWLDGLECRARPHSL